MPCGSRRLPASYTRPRSSVGTFAQPDTPDHEQDAEDGDEEEQTADQDAAEPLLIVEHEREGLADVHRALLWG